MDEKLANLVAGWLSADIAESDCARLLEVIASEGISPDELYAMADVSAKAGDYFTRKKARRRIIRQRAFGWSFAAACLAMVLWIGSDAWISSSRTYSTEAGQTRSVCLKDGTRVVLNSGSTLSVPRNYSADNRSVTLDGEAAFYVQKSSSPLSVKTSDHGEIIVYGTVFNARTYSNDTRVEIALSEGSVSYKPDASIRPFTIEPGERIIFDKTAHVVDIDNADLESCFAWNSGRIVFSDMCFSDIINTLERKYGCSVSLKLSDLSLMARRFSLSIGSDDNFEAAVSQLADAASIKINTENGKVTIFN